MTGSHSDVYITVTEFCEKVSFSAISEFKLISTNFKILMQKDSVIFEKINE